MTAVQAHVRRAGASGSGLVTVIGAINWDVSIFEDAFAQLGEEVAVREVEEFSGGKGANAAVAAARMLGKGKAAIVGALGSDELASRQVRELKKEGVVTDGVVRITGTRSGRAFVIVNRQGRKSIHTDFAANGLLVPSLLEMGGPAGILSRTSTLVVMDPPSDVALAAVKRARSSEAMVIYSPGVRVREKWEALADIVERSGFLVLDKAELVKLSGKTDVIQASEYLQRSSRGLTVVATSGKRGCVVVSKERTTRLGGFDLSPLGMKVVNSTGSGDAFLGVLASFLSWGYEATEAARWANLAGALKATRYETRGSPTRALLQETMNRLRGRTGKPKG